MTPDQEIEHIRSFTEWLDKTGYRIKRKKEKEWTAANQWSMPTEENPSMEQMLFEYELHLRRKARLNS